MTKVTVMTDGYMNADTADALMEIVGESLTSTKLNGIVAVFSDDADAQAARTTVLADPRLKGKLSNLYIGAV